ncbi:MAG: TIGR02147 family protein [Fibrobacteres bacterium]|nr:TIGR02147 family protein [Fibrobacterota bacterium]MBK9578499.1 TIGR02147 family protein [Fibrobacterota bacterium]QQS07493.1 MAG: TIGR02147 family protein [Fibrobacterota bacterium]
MDRIESYTDYRKFLRDFYETRKRGEKGFSHRSFCQKAGLSSPSYLREVIDGKRNLTDVTIPQFVLGLELTSLDARYFSLLVRFNQSVDPALKQQALDQMRGMRQKVDAAMVTLDRHDYYSRWYHPVLRELACQRIWKDDWAAMARCVRPRIRKVEVREGMELLERLGFLARRGDRWIQTDPVITSGGEVDSMAVRAGNRQYAKLGAEAIDDQPPSRRDISTMIFGLPESSYPQIKQEIREFKDRVARIVHDQPDCDRVFALNVQLFALAEEES